MVALVIVAGLALRLVLGGVLGLAVDESYTVTISRQLSASYFDHPPLSFWIPGILQRLGVHGDLALRLPFILLFAVTTWLMFRLTSRYWGERAGMYAAIFLNLAPVFALSTGGWILPDGPLELAMLASVACVARVVLAPDESHATWWWAAAGFFAGLAFLSKYHAVFLVFGVLLYVVTVRDARRWLARPAPWVAAAIALLFLVPVVVWNARHGWASFRFQGGRGVPRHGAHLAALAENLAGQAAYLLPWLWVALVWQLVRALRIGRSDRARWLMCCLAIGPIALFTAVSLGGNPGLPHWPAPGYLFLFPLLGAAAAAWEARSPRRAHRWTTAAAVAFLALVAVAASQVVTGWVSRARPQWFRRGDPSYEALDWNGLGPALARAEERDGAPPPAFVATTHWIDAAKAGYALGPAMPVLCLSDDPRHFGFLYDVGRFADSAGLLVVREEHGANAATLQTKLAPLFDRIEPAGSGAAVVRDGRPGIPLALFRVSGPRLPRSIASSPPPRPGRTTSGTY